MCVDEEVPIDPVIGRGWAAYIYINGEEKPGLKGSRYAQLTSV